MAAKLVGSMYLAAQFKASKTMTNTMPLIEHGAGALALTVILCFTIAQAIFSTPASAGNPLLPGQGVCDPQVRVFNGQVYLYATHDYSPQNKGFRMDDWWLWSTTDFLHWKHETTLQPEQTYLGKPFMDCWATDAATRNGKYYWYFSAGRDDIGVVVSDTPVGPWHDPLGKPLVPRGLTPVAERDPGILMDTDGTDYLVFGTWDFYLVRLGRDMVSLAEAPRLLVLDHKAGPYGEGKTDDKPFLHQRNGKYYLSWGCYYAMADNPYGPYTYKGSIIIPETTDPQFRTSALTHDRHGSFFEYHGQWYFICNDFSQPGTTPHFRNSILSYLHYRDNGEIAPVRIDAEGVGEYDAARGPVEAEDYFALSGGQVRECPAGGFEVQGLANGSVLAYPHVRNVPTHGSLVLHLSNGGTGAGHVEVREGDAKGPLLGQSAIPATGGWDHYADVDVKLNNAASTLNLAFVFHGAKGELARLDNWRFVAK